MGGRRAPAAALRPAGHRSRSPRPPRRHARPATPSNAPASPTTPAPPPPPSPRARPAATRTSCWPRPAPAPARRSATSPPPASGRRRTTARSGSAPSPATCSARSTPRLARLFPDPIQRRRRVVIRKGRENYLCLLNLEDAVGTATSGFMQQQTIPLGLIVRWALATDDGDVQGGDLPGWFAGTVRRRPDRQPGRPPRRVHPRRLPALAPMLRRAHHPPRPHRRTGGGQPCPGDDAGGLGRPGRQRRADPLRVRRGPPRVRRRRLARSPPPCPAHETAELRRWLLRRRRRPVARPRPGPPDGGTGRRPPGAGTPLEAALQAARALPAPGWSGRLRRRRPGIRRHRHRPAQPHRGLPAPDPPPGARPHQGSDGEHRASPPGAPRNATCFPLTPDVAAGRRPPGPRPRPHRRTARHAARTPAGPAGRRSRGDGRRHPQPHRGDRPLLDPPRAEPARRLAVDAAPA